MNKVSGVRGGRKMIREVVVTYRLEGDEEGRDYTFRITHGSEGQAVDGVVWNDDLIRKLNYDEGGKLVPVRTQNPGKEQWKTMASSDGLTGECIWLHDESCLWQCYCPE